MENTSNLMHDPSAGRVSTRAPLWAMAGLIAFVVLAAIVLMGRSSTSQDERDETSPPLVPFVDSGDNNVPPGGWEAESPGTEGEGLVIEPSPLEDTLGGEGSPSDPQSQDDGFGLPDVGAGLLDDEASPSVGDLPFRIQVPASWLVEEEQVTGGLSYLSHDGPDPLALDVLPMGAAVGNQLENFTQFMRTGMVNQGAIVSQPELVEVGERPAMQLSVTMPDNPRPAIMWVLDAGENLYSIVAELPADPATRAELSDDLEAAVQSFDLR